MEWLKLLNFIFVFLIVWNKLCCCKTTVIKSLNIMMATYKSVIFWKIREFKMRKCRHDWNMLTLSRYSIELISFSDDTLVNDESVANNVDAKLAMPIAYAV